MNKIGVKWALVIGAATFPIQGSAYYCNSKFGNQWVSPDNVVNVPSKELYKVSDRYCLYSISSSAVQSAVLERLAGMSLKQAPL